MDEVMTGQNTYDSPQAATTDEAAAARASEKARERHRSRRKRRSMSKPAMILLIAAAVLICVIIVFTWYGVWRNNGVRFAQKLSTQIGEQQEIAEKYAKLKLYDTSDYMCINMLVGDEASQHLFESKKSVSVSGVKVPQWVIYVTEEDSDIVSSVTYYNYRQLNKYGNGIKVKSHVGAEGITTNMSPDAVQKYIGFAPLRTVYNADGMQEAYKYHYKNQDTGDTTAYILYVNYENGLAVSAAEERNYFILSDLKLRD